MDTAADYRTRDLGQTRVRLRRDLVITPRLDGDHPGYLVEDPVNSRFFRIGLPEHAFISLLDGDTTIDEALRITARVEPEHAFTQQQAAAICRWLIDNQLAGTPESTRTRRLVAARAEDSPSWTQWNPWFLRIPLWHPDRFFGRVAPYSQWLFAWPMVLFALVLGLVAAGHVFVQWDRFLASARGILATDRWLWIGGAWLVIKVVHESAHAIVCKRHGGEVREAGVMLVLAAPLAYVDVSSSWRFRSKWPRIFTALAGIHVELFIAALATIAWGLLDKGRVGDLCVQVALMTSVTTLLFNANPLMRFDGYYVISDLLELPNLYSHGQQILSYVGRRCFWGIRGALPQLGPGRFAIAAVYGAAAAVWRVLVCIGLTATAAHMFHGAGVLLALAGLACWLAPPVISQAKFFWQGDTINRPRRLRFTLAATALLLVSAGTAYTLPWPGTCRAPCVVSYAPSAVIHVDSPGFVRQVLVRPGQRVAKMQTLVLLENDQLELELHQLQVELRQSETLMRAALYENRLTDYQIQKEKHASLATALREKQLEVDALTIRAPMAGSVVANDLDSLRGRFLVQGSELLTIGNENQKELHISVDQDDADAFAANVSHPVRVRLHGTPRFVALLAAINPRARKELTDPALSAVCGGPLAVRPVEQAGDVAEKTTCYQLPTPRLTGTVRLDAELSHQLWAGQRGVVSLGRTDRSIAAHLQQRVRRWFERLRPTH